MPDLWVDGIRTASRDTYSRLCRPGHLPSHSDRAQDFHNLDRAHKTSTTSDMLQRGFTAAPARFWAALCGAGCLSIRAAKAVSLYLARATSRHVFSCLGKRRAHSGCHRQSLTVVPTKSLQNSCFIGRAWPKFPSFYSTFSKKKQQKKFLKCRRCAIHARFAAVSVVRLVFSV